MTIVLENHNCTRCGRSLFIYEKPGFANCSKTGCGLKIKLTSGDILKIVGDTAHMKEVDKP